jgi:Amt family ammonium transporter
MPTKDAADKSEGAGLMGTWKRTIPLGIGAAILWPVAAFAQAAAPAAINGADTVWVLVSTALVLFMTLPGLALFYGGLVQLKHSLSVLMHCTAIACLVSILWFAFGYSLFVTEGNALLGDFSKAFLANVARGQAFGTIPETAYFLFQMAFAIITPGLIVGAFVERMKFSAMLIFVTIWSLLVYAPVAHWVWSPGGWLAQMNVRDFAGGLVVHTTAGVSALVVAAAIGKRDGYPHDLQPPHSPGLTMMGAGMLWVGWYGFNGGSALMANADAASAILCTHLAASTAAMTWAAIEWIRFKRPSLVGIVTGAVAGLATVTPASGFIGPAGAALLGVLGSVVCFYAVQLVRKRFKIDDALDVFAVHGVGGMLGTMGLAVLEAPEFGGIGFGGAGSMSAQAGAQAVAIIAIAAWSGLASILAIWVAKNFVGLRAKAEHIEVGLDLSEHGERAFAP